MTTKTPHIPGFIIDAVLSRHEHADVFRVSSKDVAEPMALKLAKTALGAKYVFKEISYLTRFAGTGGIAQCIDSGAVSNMPYLCMPLYVQTLHQHLHNIGGPLRPSDALLVFKQVTAAVSSMHKQGFLHCDLHPQNIIQDADSLWQIIDFAAVLDIKQEGFLSADRERLGTALYTSPEQREGLMQLTAASDIYALSSIACAALSGELHQNLLSAEQLEALANPTSPEIQLSVNALIHSAHERWLSAAVIVQNPALDSVLRKGLANEPSARYASAVQWYQALEQACLGADATSHESDDVDLANATMLFTQNAQLSEEIIQIKQSLIEVLLLKGKVDDAAAVTLIERHQLRDKISSPELVLQGLATEAEAFLRSDKQNAAFLNWAQNLHAYALTYGNRLTRQTAKKLVEQGLMQGAGDKARLQSCLSEHFKVQSWLAANKLSAFAVASIVALLIFVWYPDNPLIYEQAESALTQPASQPQTSSVVDSAQPSRNEDLQSKEVMVATAQQESRRTYVQPSKSFVQADTRLADSLTEVVPQTNPQLQLGVPSLSQKKIDRLDAQGNLVYTLSDPKTNNVYELTFNLINTATQTHNPIAKEQGIKPASFYVMSEEVSQGIWLACVNAGKCRQAKTISTSAERRAMLGNDHPVVNVNWYDITEDFIPYLNDALDAEFALPTMAQWLAFAFSEEGTPLGVKNIHCQNCQSTRRQFENSTMPVNGLAAGPFGLRHVYGNAQEWLQDCWQDVKLGLQRCDQAPAVGGAWMDTQQHIEQQPLSRLLKTARSMTTGFRLVKRETSD
ncbi:SUMF1/EgtB/PvdO family nonheme iron enzyme [Glaciecola sp. SC05]|uniref:protein kinase domain-containing protein n=1 Tax=Glaciecola sp. SC05 TaxID=1987355 RepID=UPI0035294680